MVTGFLDIVSAACNSFEDAWSSPSA